MLTRLKSPQAAARWLREWASKGTLRTDSRQVQPGDAFIAWPGYATDGRKYVPAALAAGAATCVVEAEGVEAFGFDDARIAALPGLKHATGPLAAHYFGDPTQELDVVAVTGTNGKTSSSWWVAQALNALGRGAGVVGTLGVGVPPQVRSTGLTTPDPVTLQAAFRDFVDRGYEAASIEASSIGIVEGRLTGTRIAAALFTNFTRDHLDYHGTMEAYWAAKAELFAWPGLKAAVVNVDDEQGAKLAVDLAAESKLDVWTYSLSRPARLQASRLGYRDGGLSFVLREGEQEVQVRTTLIGDYNASNLLAVLGGLRALDIPLADAAGICPLLTPVPGRMQRVGGTAGLPVAVVDYAHTPDALDKALQAVRSLARQGGGQLWCVFGCGGNRDATKRPLMGGIAARAADRVVITSDNPRDEEPAQILAQIQSGVARGDGVEVIEDRRVAIIRTLQQAAPGDVVLIAGKGHEDYQEVRGVKLPFSDVQVAEEVLSARRPA
ncbi:MAG TPA: UDP-N-acetylmuramoyl-L-alanyl-D-glutamate--2,6-diaminopimelate ligase [Methylibium sp.]